MCSTIRSDASGCDLFTGNQEYDGGSEVASRKWHGNLILKAAACGTLIFGICGGYQMLGEKLSDPYGVEAGGSMRGMGLLPMDTVFAEIKQGHR